VKTVADDFKTYDAGVFVGRCDTAYDHIVIKVHILKLFHREVITVFTHILFVIFFNVFVFS